MSDGPRDTLSFDAELPAALRARLQEIVHGPADERSAALETLCREHPEHALLCRVAVLAADGRLLDDDPDGLPSHIGPFRVLDVLGRGGMGTVYLAEQKKPVRRRVALKVIKLGMDSDEVLARFDAERQALALMNHQHIAKIYEAGTTSRGQPYFAMEHVPGLPLTEHCDQYRLGMRARIELFAQVCEGVQHAHHKGVIHRDLKPSNVLVSVEQERAVPKIIDFGLARATDHHLVEATIFTALGHAIGTPGYMSPEQAMMSSEDIDTRTDVYSLGVVLYELLVGGLPFPLEELEKLGLLEMRRHIRDHEPPKPSTRLSSLLRDATTQTAKARSTTPDHLLRELRGDLDWIVMKALEKDRNRRYATASELAADVRRYLDGEPVLASPPTTAYRLRKILTRHRGKLLAGTAVGLSILAGTAVSTWFAFEAHAEEQLRTANEQRLRAFEDRTLVLATIPQVADAIRAARALPAPWPEHRDAYDTWIARYADPLTARLASIQANTANDQLTRIEDPVLRDAYARGLTNVERRLEEFHARWPDFVGSRAAWLRTVEQQSIDERRDAWNAAIRAIAASPHYAGLEIEPQLGLVPIGANPVTGLWEFYHLLSAADPERIPTHAADGSIRVAPETGIVFVLLPGGHTTSGAQPFDRDRPGYDADAHRDEGPVLKVELDAFFVSRFELTQAQWMRLTGDDNPARFRAPSERFPEVNLSNPVEKVSWTDATTAMAMVGLELPTGAQWEYAARAGATGRYPGTGRPRSLTGIANLGDDAAVGPMLTGSKWPGVNDGYATHARVGAFAPNAWGLHDVHGNVWELISDYTPSKSTGQPTPAPGNGALPEVATNERRSRGGSYADGPTRARFTAVAFAPADIPLPVVGLRPARRVLRR